MLKPCFIFWFRVLVLFCNVGDLFCLLLHSVLTRLGLCLFLGFLKFHLEICSKVLLNLVVSFIQSSEDGSSGTLKQVGYHFFTFHVFKTTSLCTQLSEYGHTLTVSPIFHTLKSSIHIPLR